MDRSLRAAVEERLRGVEGGAIEPGPAAEPAPLSFAQERLWFLHQLDPDSAAYNIPLACRLRGPVDVTLLRRALDDIGRRHHVLRSVMDSETTEEPVQRTGPPVPVKLTVTEVGGVSTEDRLRQVAVLAREQVLVPFDLRTGPLLRADLFRVGDDDHVLLLCVHHIIADQWTLTVLWHEITELYTAFLLDLPAPLPEPPLQYADFARWQRDRLTADRLDGQLGYWRDRLAGLEPLDLYPDHPRPATQTWHGARVRHRIPAAAADEVRRLAGEHDVTMFTVVAAALSALLGRYTGQSDVAIGAAMADRGRPELEQLVGFFVNTVVLRTDLSADPSFTDLLAATRETTLQARENQDLPFERLVDALGPDRDLSRPPLVSVVLSYLNTPAESSRLPGATAEEFPFDPGIAKFELDIYVQEADGGLTVDVDYRRDLFEPATITRFLGHLENLLTEATKDPARLVSALPILTPEQTELLLAWGNASEPLEPVTDAITDLFARRVALAPDSAAVRHRDGVLTYRDLDEQAGRMARALLARRPDGLGCVGVCLDRSPELIVTLLAVLQAGGHYLPLDPNYPQDRLTYMLADADAGLLVTSGGLADRIDGWTGPTVLVDAFDARAGQEALPARSPEDLAYVMYTSGSTGRPKGIRVPQRGVVRLVDEPDYLRIGPGDRVAHASSVSFDAATLEIWGALLTGAELVIVPQEVVVEPRVLAGYLREHEISVLWMTSSLFNHTVRQVPDAVASVGTVLVGGEALDPGTIRAVLASGAPGRLVNGYGPTENTTFTTTFPIESLAEGATSVPIGRPISGTRCYVVDAELRLVPPGAPGELCAAGLGLAHGYVGAPELTEKSFRPDPHGGPGEKLYRTGDLVRWRDDGVLEYLGRRDDQVKVRGYRIELGEIESALAEQPGVASAVVLVRAGDDGDRLVAYVAADGDPAQVSTSDLQEALGGLLPGYMVPSGFLVLDRFPLTANGKADRAKLAGMAVTSAAKGFVAPRDEIEAAVCELWAELLKVERVSVTDNFFHLGGDSLLATRVASRIRKVVGVRVTVRTLFDQPTAEAFASALSRLKEAAR